jgi:hypothetical protein
LLFGQEDDNKTTFKFGGYIKADFLHTWYNNGDVGSTSPLRDFHLPSQIPVGETDRNYDLDYHVKESRFNFDVKTKLLGKEIHGFLELDFLLSSQGDEKVSNSFNPRLRHFYMEWDRLLIGQTWSTFMIVVVPDEIDFSGALDGLVFNRQPQVRYKAGNWWFALENPETTINPFESSAVQVTDSEILPDVIVRRNFAGDWGTWGAAAMFRTLHVRDTSDQQSALGFGLSTGGKLIIGKKGDDIRMMFTGGMGMGRYLAANFIAGAAEEQDKDLNPIPSFNGYIAYNHFWKPKKLSSSFSVSAFQAFNDSDITPLQVNKTAYSISGNLKYDPVPVLRLGVEYMYGYREIENGTSGSFHRIQVAAKYTFGYHNAVADEKR